MEIETPGTLRPKGGTKRFRQNCRLLAEEGAIVAVDRRGNATRYALDGSEDAPKAMITYLGKEPFVIVDGKGLAIVSSPYLLWDADERAAFCKVVDVEFGANTVDPEPAVMRSDGVRLEEPAWLRRYIFSAPYVLAAGVGLAPLGRALDLPIWLMLPFIPWLAMYPVVRATGYFAPRRVGPADIAFQEEIAEYAQERPRKRRRRKANTP